MPAAAAVGVTGTEAPWTCSCSVGDATSVSAPHGGTVGGASSIHSVGNRVVLLPN